jgi:hypothetical protein
MPGTIRVRERPVAAERRHHAPRLCNSSNLDTLDDDVHALSSTSPHGSTISEWP